MRSPLPGQVITFYSYKGGTGRSMALANVACLLARGADDGRGVLMVDWDLDAPGLHEYFRSRFQREFGDAPETDRELDDRPGLIDLFRRYEEALTERSASRPQTRSEARRLVEMIDPLPFVLETDVPGLYLLKAGRFDGGYSSSVSTFPWEELYQRSPWLVRAFADRLTECYSHVLMDSRTGLSDISGICTMLLPERLVAVFTPNRQSLDGVYDLIRRAANYRRQSADLRPLVAFPLPSRIDAERGELRKAWRYGDPGRNIAGFQPGFERLFQEVYDLEACSLEEYFGEVQIQHTPDFAYGEEVAVLTEWGSDRFDLTHSYERLADVLAFSAAPWELSHGPALDPAQKLAREAEAAFSRLSPQQQDSARRILTQLVRLAMPEEGGRDTGIAVQRSQLRDPQTLDALLADGVLKLGERDKVELADESLIQSWVRLGKWLLEDREFLLWRQGLRSGRLAWLQSGQPREGLLTGRALAEARRWLSEKRYEDLGAGDLEFVLKSEGRRTQWLVLKGLAAGLGLVVLVGSSFWITRIYKTNLYRSLLESWGLPSDLYERQGQLRALTLPSVVNRVDWLAEGLEELTLVGSKAESLEGLPASLKSLEITGTTVSDLTMLPTSLRRLKVEMTGQLDSALLPASLESLSLTDLSLQEPHGLPARLRRLTLQAPLRHLEGLPRSLNELSLRGAQMRDLNGLPPGLKSFELSESAVVSLDGLPASVESLALVENSRLREGELPEGLLLLRLEENPLYMPVVLPGRVRYLVLNFELRGNLPPSLESLQIPVRSYDRLGSFPLRLRELRALTLNATPDTMTANLIDLEDRWPFLEELDLGRMEVQELSLPRRLRTLHARFGSKSELPDLPSTLETLDVSRSGISRLPAFLPPTLVTLDVTGSRISSLPKLPPTLRELFLGETRISRLDGLPSGLKVLDISGTPIDRLHGLPPHLTKLTLNVGQVRSLEGLPVAVMELRFLHSKGGGSSPF